MQAHQEQKTSMDGAQMISSLINGCRTALAQPNGQHYQFLVKKLQCGTDRYLWFEALSSCVSLIKSTTHQTLIQTLLTFDWQGTEQDRLTYGQLLVHLNCAHGVRFLTDTFWSLIQNFEIEGKPIELSFHPIILSHSHTIIRQLLATIPNAHGKLWPVLQENFPGHRTSIEAQRSFVKNLLEILDYCPLLNERIIHLLIDKIIVIDVSIKIEEIPDADTFGGVDDSASSQEEQEPEMFNMDLDLEEGPQACHKENANKLDAIIDLFISFVVSRKTDKEQDDIFDVLIRVFDSLILSTYKSKYTQFILFYMCRLKPDYVNRFLAFLCEKITTLSASTSTLLLQSSAAYIGSFVSRAMFIAPSATLSVLTTLLHWLHDYIGLHDAEQPDGQKHALFYSICQSALYIFCFKHAQLDIQSIRGLNFNRIIRCSLNPLKLILVEIGTEFASIFNQLGYPDATEILEQNKSVVLPTNSVFGGLNQVDSFFPFDPFLLRTSSKHFKGAYQFWSTSKDPQEHPDDSSSIASDRSCSPSNSPRRRSSISMGGMSLSYGDDEAFSYQSSCSVDPSSWGGGFQDEVGSF